jgi:phosphohistidine phosphatase
MELFLLRHADASTEAASDDARRLSEKGIVQAGRIARFCEAHVIVPALILASPVRRAHETAQIVNDVLRSELVTVRWLACGMRPETALEELRAYEKFERVMIVGHEPDFSVLIAHLLGLTSSENFHVRKGSLTHLTVGGLTPRGARLEFSIPTRLM